MTKLYRVVTTDSVGWYKQGEHFLVQEHKFTPELYYTVASGAPNSIRTVDVQILEEFKLTLPLLLSNVNKLQTVWRNPLFSAIYKVKVLPTPRVLAQNTYYRAGDVLYCVESWDSVSLENILGMHCKVPKEDVEILEQYSL